MTNNNKKFKFNVIDFLVVQELNDVPGDPYSE